MSNATSIWSVRYPASEYPAGDYNVEVNVIIPIFWPITDNISQHRRFRITCTYFLIIKKKKLTKIIKYIIVKDILL